MKFWSNHSCIRVSDMTEELAFYSKAIGFTTQSICQHTTEIVSYFIGQETGTLLQLLALPGYTPEHQAYGHFSVATDNIRDAHARHEAMGCAVGPIVDQGHQFSYFIRDPEGYETEIIQPKKYI